MRSDRRAPDTKRSKRTSAPDTVIRHREVARTSVESSPEGPGSIIGGEVGRGGCKSRAPIDRAWRTNCWFARTLRPSLRPRPNAADDEIEHPHTATRRFAVRYIPANPPRRGSTTNSIRCRRSARRVRPSSRACGTKAAVRHRGIEISNPFPSSGDSGANPRRPASHAFSCSG